MKLSALHVRKSSIHNLRRGVLTAWTIWLILAAGVIAGGLFNAIWLSAVRNQAHHCAAVAALAAGHSYLSDDMLRSCQQPFEYDGRVARCQQAAVSMVDQYRNGTPLPPISAELVRVEWPDNQGPVSDPALLVPRKISVSFDSHHEQYHLPMFFGGLTGLRSTRMGVQCCVALEHAPTAFRPSPKNNVPMLPFAICDDILPLSQGQGTTSAGYWTSSIESGKGKDSFSWNDEARKFEPGQDGLPEVTVTIYSSTSPGSSDAFIPIAFSAGPKGPSGPPITAWIQEGLTEDNVKSLGREELSFPNSLSVIKLNSLIINECKTALDKKIGEPCLICLCSTNLVNGSQTSVTIKRPVAARIAQVTRSLNGAVKVVLQPCVLTTSTAITSRDPDIAMNRYVYSIRLCN